MIDRVDTTVSYEEAGPFRYTGQWELWNSPLHSENGIMASHTPGSYVELTFEGTSFKWIGNKRWDRGMADVYVDGVLVANNVDLYSSTIIYQAVYFEKTGLSPGTHTLKIVVDSYKNPSSSGYWAVIDCIEVQ